MSRKYKKDVAKPLFFSGCIGVPVVACTVLSLTLPRDFRTFSFGGLAPLGIDQQVELQESAGL